MVDENETKAGFDERPATEAQVQLALQLYKECDYKRAYTEQELAAMNRAEISKHVAYVKEYKNVQQQQAIQNARVPGFEKITFAMLWKLLWTEDDVKYYKHRCQVLGTQTAFCEQYDFYKEVETAVKKHVAEGGQQ